MYESQQTKGSRQYFGNSMQFPVEKWKYGLWRHLVWWRLETEDKRNARLRRMGLLRKIRSKWCLCRGFLQVLEFWRTWVGEIHTLGIWAATCNPSLTALALHARCLCTGLFIFRLFLMISSPFGPAHFSPSPSTQEDALTLQQYQCT